MLMATRIDRQQTFQAYTAATTMSSGGALMAVSTTRYAAQIRLEDRVQRSGAASLVPGEDEGALRRRTV